MTSPHADLTLGRLEPVEPRNIWASEASDFTPWLAREENIALLGETIGIELEVEAQEKRVGPFRADILCKDTITGHFVLIENQLEVTDHGHLGQLMTYAAGLDAVTIVWVARRFGEEHRAALDWLNRVTEKDLNFFGLEVELWRIGSSVPAPKFNVVSKPNDWSKTVRDRAQAAPGAMTPSQQLHLEYWTQLRDHLEFRQSHLRIGTPSTDHWRYFPLGKGGFTLSAVNGMRDGWSSVSLVLTGQNSKAHFYLIRDRYAADIVSQLGAVTWEELPNNNESRVTLLRQVSPADKAGWPTLNEWFRQHLEQWTAFFRPIVATLDASEYVPPDSQIDLEP